MDLHDSINHKYFDMEAKGINTYLKQRIVMKIYHSIKYFSKCNLSDIWKEVNMYFHLLNNPKHTVEKSHVFNPYVVAGERVKYCGD